MKITAAVIREKSGAFSLEDLEIDEPRDNEVLVRVVGAGICHTDLACRDQYYPIPLPCVFGHEGAGIVEKVGARVKKVQPGDHVVLSYMSCGSCAYCIQGNDTHCLYFGHLNFGGTRLDGSSPLRKNEEFIFGSFFGQSSFANFALANERNVVKVSQDLPLERLGPLGCGVITGSGAVINCLHARPGSSIAVFGTGTVGMSAILAAVVCGCTTIIGVDLNPDRLKLAREFGATHTVNPSETDPVAAIQEITGLGVNYSLECIGLAKVLRQAVDALAPMGMCGLIGASPWGTEVSLDMNGLLVGRAIRGIAEGDAIPDIFIPMLIDLWKKGRFPFDRMIKFYPLSEINQAVEDMEKGRTIKPVVKP